MKRIVQIEMTNHCNRHCVYCGNPIMKRPKGFISDTTIERCIWLLKQIRQTDSVGLHHFGESTLHPKLVDYIKRFNEEGITPFLNTNGDFLTDDLITKLAETKLSSVVISGHLEFSKRYALYEKCVAAGITAYWQTDMVKENGLTTMGGQVPIETMDPNAPVLIDPMTQCGFLRKEMGIILWNGDITTCCFDYEGHGIFGNIFYDNVVNLKPVPFSVCATCPGHPAEP